MTRRRAEIGRRIRSPMQARALEGEALMRRMNMYGLLDECQNKLDYVLASMLKTSLKSWEASCECSIINDEKYIDFSLTSPFEGGRPGGVKQKNQKAVAKKASSGDDDEVMILTVINSNYLS
uniref:Uncharacterized protein n=1 Tax=Lactuca sativa TaxID=4236 RepID=A0A9R1X1F3_LACSA|nr:hypothetical protein LSAT_V11C700348160 [Lactuca sativa]